MASDLIKQHVLNGEYLAAYGEKLVENGYQIVPIRPGSKSPGFDGWQKTKATAKTVRNWLVGGFEDAGVGILTAHTPAIDIDVLDRDVSEKIEKFCTEEFGFSFPTRIGKAPKRLLLFRTNEPFKKLFTAKYKDEWGDVHRVEILGEGQQFVAYAIHMDTRMPYKWVSEGEPINVHADELPELSADDLEKLLEFCEQAFEDAGFERQGRGKSALALPSGEVDDDPMAQDGLDVEIEYDDLKNALMLVPDVDDYDNWLKVGFALHYHFDGAQEGLDLWHEWSETADNYEPEVLNAKWPSLSVTGKGVKAITARYILKIANEVSTTLSAQKAVNLKQGFIGASTVEMWQEAAAAVRKAELDPLSRAELVAFARKKHQEITGMLLPTAEIRKRLAYEVKFENGRKPSWLDGWVWDASEDRFFHLEIKVSMTVNSFNMVYGRDALSKADRLEGRVSPAVPASEQAMHTFKLRVVNGKRYSPGDDDVFLSDGFYVANTYATHLIPQTPAKLKPFEVKAIERVKAHVAHLLEDEREQRILIDWLAWVVQNPGGRLNWAIVLQGVEGDGKSFFGFLLRAVMGQSNVRMLNAQVLEGNFSGWSFGQCVTVIEEPRLHGANKYDVLNRMKTYITNPVIEVHPKGKDPYNVRNTTNYFIPTNYRDALPLIGNDRRYCVLFSKWQDGASLRAFVEKNPEYYTKLYRAIEDAAPALRKWLLEHEVADDFPAGGIAPLTRAHEYMVKASQPEAMRAIEEIIDDDTEIHVSRELINLTRLPEALLGYDIDFISPRLLASLLENSGYTFLGRIRSGPEVCRFWSKTPEKFRVGFDVSPGRINAFLFEREKRISRARLIAANEAKKKPPEIDDDDEL